MIFYIEDLQARGLTAADLAGGGQATARWSEISAELLDRAQKRMKVTQ